MISLCIIGTRTLACPGDQKRARDRIAEEIERLRPNQIISGGAFGVDSIAETVATLHHYDGDGLLVLRPTLKRWDGPGGYRERNLLMIDKCTHLLRLYCIQASSGGSLWTANQARTQGKPVVDEKVCRP